MNGPRPIAGAEFTIVSNSRIRSNAAEDGDDDRLFTREVTAERARRDLRRGRDLLDGRVVVALLDTEMDRGVDQRCATPLASREPPAVKG